MLKLKTVNICRPAVVEHIYNHYIMKTSDKKEKPDKDNRLLPINQEETVRGSGFSYCEKEERTDKSIPRDEVEEEQVVKLPNLGLQNRP